METKESPFTIWLKDTDDCPVGYQTLSDCPEISTAIERIADLISNMTIYLMQNGKQGDKRIKNNLSRKIDINPYTKLTRSNWIFYIVKCMLLKGNSIVKPITRDGIIEDLIPIPPGQTSFRVDISKMDYRVLIGGKEHNPSDLLHFKLNVGLDNPFEGKGYTFALTELAKSLRTESNLKNNFMTSNMLPSLIIKVDALNESFKGEEGRDKIAEKYLTSKKSGTPWIIPAELIQVEQVKPLTLSDIAINDTITLDKKSLASVLGIPSFLLNVGDFNRQEYNNFIKTRIMPIARNIEQELTKKLLISQELYFKFNIRSLYSYDIQEITNVGGALYTKGIITGNELRAWIDLDPLDGLDDLIILENYIPKEDIAKQKKLKE